jgi:hypothetical protein
MVTALDKGELSLRRYTRHTGGWGCEDGWHQAKNPVGEVDYVASEDNEGRLFWAVREYPRIPHDDSRWPTHCEKGCGYAFTEEDEWQHFHNVWYQRPETGEKWIIHDLPPGAMYDAFWMGHKGPDGLSLQVICPNGAPWAIDGRASNCTMPEDNVHWCWIRHGEPPEITVDKNGPTCAAGAGSIQARDYHGFLQNGWLTE